MTTAQRNAIASPVEAVLIYNTTTQCYDGYNASTLQWVSFGCIGCQLPGAFSASTASSIASTSFAANWTASSGATTYYLDVSTVNTFASFVSGYNNLNVGNVITSSVTGLTADTTYYYRVRAGNACGTSANSNTVTATTSSAWSCGTGLLVSHTAGNVSPVTVDITYGTVSTAITGATKCWITRNLGATTQATSATDNTDASAGWYWQFNRKQGYAVGPTPAWTITSITEDSNWTAANDPCTLLLGTGWRLPTSTEWTNADGAPQNWANYNDTYASVLKLHAAGYLDDSDGALNYRGPNGSYWSSSQNSATHGWYLHFDSGYSYMNYNNKAYGFGERCLKD